jgi:hypothetical protein
MAWGAHCCRKLSNAIDSTFLTGIENISFNQGKRMKKKNNFHINQNESQKPIFGKY